MDYEIHPCDKHRTLLSVHFTFERALQIADDCPRCSVVEYRS